MVHDDGGGEVDRTFRDLKTRHAEIKQKLQSPIPSEDELWNLVLAPLDLLQIVPSNLPLRLRKHAVWPASSEGDQRTAQRNIVWITDIQKILLEKVFIDWNDVLQAEGVLHMLLQQWFTPDASPQAGSIYIATLSTISTTLSKAQAGQRLISKPIQGSDPGLGLSAGTASIATILRIFIANFSLGAVLQNLELYQSEGRRDVIWKDVLRDLISLPDRVANAYEGKGPHELERRYFVISIARQVESSIREQSSPDLVSALLLKLLRSGYLEETVSDWEEPVNIWPTIIRQTITRAKSDYGIGWSPLIKRLSLPARMSVTLSLVSFLDRYSLKKGRFSSLLNGDELLRAGTEGSLFLSKNTWITALHLCSIIGPILSTSDDSDVEDAKGNNADTDEEEDEDDGDYMPLLGHALLPSSKGYWSPLTARILVNLLCKQLGKAETVVLSRLLGQAIDLWSSPSRIKSAVWEQEIYLTTVIILLAAQLPASSVVVLCTSSTFIAGVSCHLEHLSPNVRRMGMLVAEVVSTSNTSIKPLTFARAIWEGKGEGKEEARVLRALFHGWSDRATEADTSDVKSVLLAFHLHETEDIVVVDGERPLIRQEKKKPSTRARPAKRPAPSRKKPLIQAIEDDVSLEHATHDVSAESLPSLTNIQRARGDDLVVPSAYISEGEGRSSSEDDSSASEGDGETTVPTEAEQKEEFGLGMPEKKRRRAPVYIHDLVLLLRESEREANKLALKHTELLIKKKARWGGEVDENAVNLSLALLALQNNYGFKHFEERKKSALTALVVASPSLVGPCLCEQYYNQQYSITQRVGILNSLAIGARELSMMGHGEAAAVRSISMQMKAMTDGFSNVAINRARVEGEARVPEIRRETALMVRPRPTPRSLDAAAASNAVPSMTVRTNVYLDLAGSCFIFPLVNRFWSQLDHVSVTRARRYKGSGSSTLMSPFMVSAFLDTLAVLCYCAQNALPFQNDIVPEVINLCLTITNTALARTGSGGDPYGKEDEEDNGGGPTAILGAAANLLLLLFDAIWQSDCGRNMLRRYSEQINQVQVWAEAIFESVESEGALSRSGRCSAALLLRISEIKQRNREQNDY
ncbi:hypothetical protein CBS101457_004773 [Exobasidium rhododendri]|nr:hypothetical protein CBS101457_004773 [Exobasidium rhododendri]